jgi:hypothetical protein
MSQEGNDTAKTKTMKNMTIPHSYFDCLCFDFKSFHLSAILFKQSYPHPESFHKQPGASGFEWPPESQGKRASSAHTSSAIFLSCRYSIKRRVTNGSPHKDNYPQQFDSSM